MNPTCSLCSGTGRYQYDHNHSQPCPKCCKHDAGWWELTEHHSGFVANADNRCCLKGCGALHRDLFPAHEN